MGSNKHRTVLNFENAIKNVTVFHKTGEVSRKSVGTDNFAVCFDRRL